MVNAKVGDAYCNHYIPAALIIPVLKVYSGDDIIPQFVPGSDIEQTTKNKCRISCLDQNLTCRKLGESLRFPDR
jgi:hypothetical protein